MGNIEKEKEGRERERQREREVKGKDREKRKRVFCLNVNSLQVIYNINLSTSKHVYKGKPFKHVYKERSLNIVNLTNPWAVQ